MNEFSFQRSILTHAPVVELADTLDFACVTSVEQRKKKERDMSSNSPDIGKLSLTFGISTIPLSIISFICFTCACLGRVTEINGVFRVLFFVIIGITCITAIASIVFGIIGINHKSESKRKAIIGIVLSSVMLVGSVCIYYSVFLQPSNMNFVFYII